MSTDRVGQGSYQPQQLLLFATPELVRFLHVCVLHGLDKITQKPNRVLKERMAGFKDLVTQDSTIIRLHERLAWKWPATRTKNVAAGVRLSLLFDLGF